MYSATASICGKLSLTDASKNRSQWVNMILSLCSNTSDQENGEDSWAKCWIYISAFRLLCFAAMMMLNILQLSSFLKALERKGSLPVTVVSSAVSFILTGILGSLILDEHVSFQWLMGAACIAAGVGLVAFSQSGNKR